MIPSLRYPVAGGRMASKNIAFGYVVIPILLLAVSFSYVGTTSLDVSTSLCIEEERVALLKFKKDLKDPGNCLSSWVGKHCCDWAGIQCDNQTGHVLMLDLKQSHIRTNMSEWSPFSGELNPSLTHLKHLIHLDLSFNDFQGIPIPKFIGSLSMLRYLDLSNAKFSGMVPPQIGNLSNLHYLDISTPRELNISGLIPPSLSVREISWLSLLSSLQYLGMNGINITSTTNELFRAVSMIPSLLELRLSHCHLGTLPPSLPFENITSLSVLDLSRNYFDSDVPYWLFNMSTLTELYISSSSLRGPFSAKLGRGNLCKLQILDLSFNEHITGDITEVLEALSCSNRSLGQLGLESNKLTGRLPNSLWQFNNLSVLLLSSNSLSGPIPASIGNLSNLAALFLYNNMVGGEIPDSIGKLTKLSHLSLLENFWEGTMTNMHFHNLTNLHYFSVSSQNNSLALKVTHDWVPPFKDLYEVEIINCQVGPTFPNWLRYQMSLSKVILMNVGISEIPLWLFNMSSQIIQLALSSNKIRGDSLAKALNFSSSNPDGVDTAFHQLNGSIPLSPRLSELYLSNNSLSGTIPVNIGKVLPHLEILDLSNNYFSRSIPLSIDRIQNLVYLCLDNNFLTGQVPIFWMGLQNLSLIDLSNNNFSGGIPTTICSSLPSLVSLILSSNSLSADLSSTFQNCTHLVTLVLNDNRFFGSIPKEVSTNLPLLSNLLLRGNTVTGSIPEDLCHLPYLHVLDLAENRISGSIPSCLGDVYGYKLPQTYYTSIMYVIISLRLVQYVDQQVVIKGITMHYNHMLVQSTIDLSKNELTGEIPEKLTELVHLGALNLSRNHLTGNIPSNIGSLTDLESLDLSHNHLSGPIPPSMTSLTFLSYLNLSYNNLSGQIPVANQFATFIADPSIYVGNPHLCGTPLPTNCSSSLLPGNGEQERRHEEDASEGEDKTERLWLYASIALGYITGFWVVCGSLVLKRSWRHAYFNFVYDLRDKLLVFIAVKLAHAKRRFGLERN